MRGVAPGRTGLRISALGVGGHHLGDLATTNDAIRLAHDRCGHHVLRRRLEYYNGKSETWLGKGRRDKIA
jgi:hypothetical protein